MGFRAGGRRGTAVLMNPLTVHCHYCGAAPHEHCRQTMLDNRPVTDIHQLRIEYARESL